MVNTATQAGAYKVRTMHSSKFQCRPWALSLGAWMVVNSLPGLAQAQPASSTASPPAPGRYSARLCVQPLAGPAAESNCGPADALVQRGNKAVLRISDIVYRLELHSSQVDVVLMHGTMQIDGFTTVYDWQGDILQFDDREKGMRYAVHFVSPQVGAR